MSDVLWRRLEYFLTPQLDIYEHLAPLMTELNVIDIGCGTGFGTLQLTRYARSVIGIDIDKDAIVFAQKVLPGVRWEWGDIARGVSYIGKGFDAVLMIEVLEHVSDWQAAMRHVNDILSPGGYLYISARNANADLRKNDLHEREWRADQFVAALKAYFSDVQLYDYRLKAKLDTDTRQTPLVAKARKEKE